MVAVNLVQHGSNVSHPLWSMVETIRRLKNYTWNISFSHIYREANMVANGLANLAQRMDRGLHILYTPSPAVSLLSLRDVLWHLLDQYMGQIINLINVDVERIGDFCWYIHGIWLLPVQVILAWVILYINLVYSPSVAAFAVTILFMVCNTPLANMHKSLRSKITEAKDSRIKVTSETKKNIRILKLNSCESTFLQKLL
ncbi:ABC transporter C family member 3 [Spatholobus suberectus]|nr:ABC transporter C family member 3 [Spatholobus suberectus]